MTFIKHILGITLLLGICSSIHSQTFQFDHYGTSDGIHFPFIYTIEQDESGYLLIGTGEGLYQFDGFGFKTFMEKDSLAEDFILSSYSDENGTIWLGHNNGSVTKYDGESFTPIDLSLYTTSRINEITGDGLGNIWAVTQNDGLIKLRAGKEPKSYYKNFSDNLIYDAQWIGDRLLLATDEGLITAKEIDGSDSFELEYVDNSPISSQCISSLMDGLVAIGTEDEGLFIIDTRQKELLAFEIGADLNLDRNKMADVLIDNAYSIWVSTLGNSLIQLVLTKDFDVSYHVNYGVDEQITENVQTCFKDREGNLWIGTYGDGLSRLVDHHFSSFGFYNDDNQKLEVHAYYSIGDTIWVGTNKNLLQSVHRPNNVIKKFSVQQGLPKDSITGIYLDPHNDLWVSTSRNGVYHKPSGDSLFSFFELNNDRISQLVTSFCGYGDALYVGTKNGLFKINTETDSISAFTNRDGLLHNKIRALFVDSKGTLWIGTEGNGLNKFEDGRFTSVQIRSGSGMYVIRSITEDQLGNIWVGTEGEGLVCMTDSIADFSNESGLYSNYCKTIITDQFNNIWIGHTGGVSKVNLNSRRVIQYGEENGLDLRFNDNCAFLDEKGMLWMGASQGLMKYDYTRDITNEIEPALSLVSVQIGDKNHPVREEINLPSGSYKFKVEFIGVSHKNPDEVSYSYILEGHDLEWSEKTYDRFVQYNRIDPGNYVFKVKTYNSDKVGGEIVKSFSLNIDTPFWQKAWFIILLVIALFLLIRYIIHRREKFLRANQEYLQTKLEERTKEVVDQKELLELKNNDIMASIEYAKNIQKAMLPAPDKLNYLFRDAFVYYKPRDIVSGDFYWAERFGNKTILACADCTGHGVPGAFMSLIGSALLKEVCNMKAIHSPDAVLNALDKELRAMVNKGDSEFGITDGMDIAVVEFDHDSNTLRCSGARRPIIVYKNGERIELRGDRRSIGGDLRFNDEFNVHRVVLEKGDSFYMFSDGVSDQFGGEKGKKLKMKGVLSILDGLNGKEMHHQKSVIRETFVDWMGNHIQVDDIILLGVRV